MKLLILIVNITVSSCIQVTGPNVCRKRESYTEEVRISKSKPYQVREFTWCMSSTFRCSKLVTRFEIELKTVNLTKWRPVLHCCDGYISNFNKTHCIPHCSKGCVNGKCTNPEICQCYNGFGGSTCNYSCPLGLYGKRCEYDCLCKNNATCDALNGQCRCLGGWRGSYCERPCRSGTYGEDCLKICKCHHGNCDHVYGNCNCHSGWAGKFCNSVDEVKKKICLCLNGGSCTVDDEECICSPGWFGTKCEQKCNSGYWGSNCVEKCSCFNDGICNRITGKCICPSGFTGNKCANMCPYETYGKDCAFNCTCNNRGACSKIDGTCTCFEGWSGISCNVTVKMKENLSCICANANLICDGNENCVCRDGYEGDNCNIPSERKNWLIYGGIALGVILICAIIITCILSIMFYIKATRCHSANPNTLENRFLSHNEESEFIPLNNMSKTKSINLYQRMNRPDHVYQEINENTYTGAYRYGTLSFNKPIREQSLLYQKATITNNLNINNNTLNGG